MRVVGAAQDSDGCGSVNPEEGPKAMGVSGTPVSDKDPRKAARS
jgi:hypothetical protein